MATGEDLFNLAQTRLGDKYEFVLVPKNNPNWHGPWDCAELASWAVFQTVGKLYGCTDDAGNPANTEAFSGSWVDDAKTGKLNATDKTTATNTPGVILIRKPQVGKRGHVALSDGLGGTVEAMDHNHGVTRGKIEGRLWHFFAKVPELTYVSNGAVVESEPLPHLLTLEHPFMSGQLVTDVQQALKAAGVDPGEIDGRYGPHTVAAVMAFQKLNGLVPDGIVGPQTASALNVPWPS